MTRLLAVSAFVVSLHAWAGWHTTTSMATIDPLDTNGVVWFDRAVVAYEPDFIPAEPKLIVIFGGHTGPDPTNYAAFQEYAASQGFHSIAIDYDYQYEIGGQPSLDPGHICGCYDNCYSWLNQMISETVTNAPSGLPGPSLYPVKDRIKSVVNYLITHGTPSGGWNNFVSGNNIVWGKLVLAGLSRGAILAARLAKFHSVDRLLMFSGPNDDLSDKWGSDGGNPTTYGWGQGGSYCQEQTQHTAVGIITDNGWNGGTAWSTQRPNMFLWLANANTTSWDRTIPAVTALHLDTFHDGSRSVGNAVQGEIAGWDSYDSHFLFAGGGGVGYVCGNPSDPNGSVHVSMLSGNCDGGSGTYAQLPALRQKVWHYMLTH